jgi:hypothetical protein
MGINIISKIFSISILLFRGNIKDIKIYVKMQIIYNKTKKPKSDKFNGKSLGILVRKNLFQQYVIKIINANKDKNTL